jgi:3-deoxy-D-arabino-heptulosonate 7-phosphate (DAHP) synthase
MPKELASTLTQSRITELRPLISPIILIEDLPCTATAAHTVNSARQAAQHIMLNSSCRPLLHS